MFCVFFNRDQTLENETKSFGFETLAEILISSQNHTDPETLVTRVIERCFFHLVSSSFSSYPTCTTRSVYRHT